MKSQIRKQLIEKRNSISQSEAVAKSKIICDKLLKDPDYKKSKTIMFYISKGNEVHTNELIEKSLKTKKVIVPKIIKDGLICCEINSLSNMSQNCFGIMEPKDEIACDISSIDLIIVPGIAFDKSGHRIGFGKGYYDKLLKNAKCKKIALAYDFQILEKIPADEWDEKIDKIITD